MATPGAEGSLRPRFAESQGGFVGWQPQPFLEGLAVERNVSARKTFSGKPAHDAGIVAVAKTAICIVPDPRSEHLAAGAWLDEIQPFVGDLDGRWMVEANGVAQGADRRFIARSSAGGVRRLRG